MTFTVGILRRPIFGLDTPLWLDETFTGAIAIEPDITVMIQQCLRDVAAPVYYWMMWVWEKLFGPVRCRSAFPACSSRLSLRC